jgi:hypothetical protein
MELLEIAAQLAQILTVVSIGVAAIAIRSNTQLSRKQWNVDVFITYSERHETVINAFPDNAFFDRFDVDRLPPTSPELTSAVRKYLHVIADVHYLFQQGYLDNSIWQIWQADLRRTLNSPLFVREWDALKLELQSFTAFLEFVEEARSTVLSVHRSTTAQESWEETT